MKFISLQTFVLFLFLPLSAKSPSSDTAYAILQNIKMPAELIAGVLPKSYQAALTLDGTVAEETAVALAGLSLPPPHYEEVFDKGKFTLRLADGPYAAQTRDLITGIVNPIAMIDLLLAGLLKYREPVQFDLLARETVLQKSVTELNGRTLVTVHLRPRGTRFGYSCEDRGGTLQETWLTALDCSIDLERHLATGIDMRKVVRVRGEAPADSGTRVHFQYRFEYETVDGHVLPAFLSVAINDSLALRVRARYRHERNALVFDAKEIFWRGDGSQSAASLRMLYGVYLFGRKKESAAHDLPPGKYALRLVSAARLAREAGNALAEGRIEAALEILRELSDQYKGTPQAIEAEKLLQGLSPY
jgi:hypothetical protein